MIPKELIVAYEIVSSCNFEKPTDPDAIYERLKGLTTLSGYKKIRAYLTRIGIIRADRHKGFYRCRQCTLYDLYRALGYEDLEGNLHRTQWEIRHSLEKVVV